MDVVTLLYEVARREREEHKREEGVYWVSDLVRCPLKRSYELRFPELVAQEVFRPGAVLGRLVHLGLEYLLGRELGDRVKVEVEKTKRITLPDGRGVEIRGRIDALVDGEVGVEVKYARSDIGIPLQHHVDQARLYNWLLGLKWTELVYVTPERVTQFRVCERADDGEVVDRVTSQEAPRYDWECQYCPYSVLCPRKRRKS